MRAEAHIPAADEALRVLFTKFKDDPGSSAFEALSDALLARGHASEAQIVAEHGLQLDPTNASGRVHRAAALLALGRARVAYVELVRALAIEPSHTRGLRLLGRVYVDAGLPERAAALLAQRHLGGSAPVSRAPSSIDARPLTEPLPAPKSLPAPGELPPPSAAVLKASIAPRGLPAIGDKADKAALLAPVGPPPDLDGENDIHDLFASLTKDLGLGGLQEPTIPSRVEVTQIMRIRRNVLDEQAELSSIDGPIVDATQPGRLQYDEGVPPSADFLFDVVTTPQLHGLGTDEPLFNDVAPLTRPASESATIDDSDTLNEDIAPVLEMSALQSAIQSEAAKKTGETAAASPGENTARAAAVLGGDTKQIAYLKRFGRAARETPGGASLPPPPVAPASSGMRAPNIQIVERSRGPRSTILAVVGAVLLLVWLIGLGWVARDTIAVWMTGARPAVSTPEHAERSSAP